MTTETKHTPTPWRSFEGENETRIGARFCTGPTQITPRQIAEVVHHGERHEQNGERSKYVHATPEDRANAAFIVRACNSHDDLLKYAMMMDVYKQWCDHTPSSGLTPDPFSLCVDNGWDGNGHIVAFMDLFRRKALVAAQVQS